MQNLMPCGLDDPRLWDEAIDTRVSRALEEQEDADPRTEAEKRLSWVCDMWADAAEIDRYEDWHDMNMALHGALLALNHCPDRHYDRMAIMELSTLAYRHSADCIQAGCYEGASN